MIDLLDSAAIYDKLDSLRKDKGWTIYELAKRAGVTSNAIYHWRDRKSSPTLAMLDALCAAMEISPVTFLMDTDELIALTCEQQELIYQWNTLSGEQRKAIINLMKSMNRSFDA
ncbi:MAG: helix-turn-helix domain-containing protein [Clostridia bacterium]|nr:helix-turn-helix domain-containing protein [Clostridia bacterium]